MSSYTIAMEKDKGHENTFLKMKMHFSLNSYIHTEHIINQISKDLGKQAFSKPPLVGISISATCLECISGRGARWLQHTFRGTEQFRISNTLVQKS